MAHSALHRSQLKSALVLSQTVQREQSCHRCWQAQGVTRGQGEAARAVPGAELSQVTPPALSPVRHSQQLGWASVSLPGLWLVGSEQHWPSGIVCLELCIVFPKVSCSYVTCSIPTSEVSSMCLCVGVCRHCETVVGQRVVQMAGMLIPFLKVLYLYFRRKLTTGSVQTHYFKRSPTENLPLLLSHKVNKTPAHAFSFKYSLFSPCIIQRNVTLWRALFFNWLHEMLA